MAKSKILPGTVIGLVIGAVLGLVFNSGQFNLVSGGIVGAIIGFLSGWFMSRDDESGGSDT